MSFHPGESSQLEAKKKLTPSFLLLRSLQAKTALVDCACAEVVFKLLNIVNISVLGLCKSHWNCYYSVTPPSCCSLLLLRVNMTLDHDGSTSYHVNPVTNDQFQQLLSAILSTQQRMEDRLCSFRKELVSSQEESTVKALKHARYNKALMFRKKGNEEQHKFNERLGTELENVTAELEHAVDTPAIARAKDSLKTDVFSMGVWTQLQDLQDPELQQLVQALPNTILHSRADSTTKKYLYAFQRWKKWAEERSEVTIFPVQEVHFTASRQHNPVKVSGGNSC